MFVQKPSAVVDPVLLSRILSVFKLSFFEESEILFEQ